MGAQHPIFWRLPLHLGVWNLPILIELGDFIFFQILYLLKVEYTWTFTRLSKQTSWSKTDYPDVCVPRPDANVRSVLACGCIFTRGCVLPVDGKTYPRRRKAPSTWTQSSVHTDTTRPHECGAPFARILPVHADTELHPRKCGASSVRTPLVRADTRLRQREHHLTARIAIPFVEGPN
jgi:hypothetical protein